MVHAHLHHGVFGGGFQAEQRVGYADVVVLVALGLKGVAKGRKHGIAKLFGRRLADAARHADDARAEQHTVVGRHAHHGQGAVGYDDRALRRHPLYRVVGDDIGRAVPAGAGGKGMAVDPLAGEADEHTARRHVAAVGHNGMDGDRFGQAQPGKQFIGGDRLHKDASFWFGCARLTRPLLPAGSRRFLRRVAAQALPPQSHPLSA